jgi:nitrate reductase gamma subunit
MHLRWELYPVPHEAPQRARHGGSRFEESDWWTRPQRRNLAGEIAFMLPEMLFLDALRKHNRPLWNRSFPFHAGLYLTTASAGVALLFAFLQSFGIQPDRAILSSVSSATAGTGVIGSALVTFGALALLHARVTDAKLAAYSAPADYLNLALFAGMAPLLVAGFALDGSGVVAVASRLVSLDTSIGIHPVLASGIVFASLVLAYIPFTHMSHFVSKWFTYHHVRWDDAVAGDRIRQRMTEYLTYRPTWSARHVGADGTKTWAEVAAADPTERGRK